MNQNIQTLEQPKYPLAMHPKKFALWLFIVSIVMIFASLTSAYIVRESDGNWIEFTLPDIFWFNSALILASSFFMHWAYISAKKDNIGQIKFGLIGTIVLGIIFLFMQVIAWEHLIAMDIYFVGNPSGSFVYVLSGLHGFHIISAIVFVIVVLVNTLKFKIHSKNMVQMEMCTTYWHFLDGLWIYLFLFLLLNN